MINEAAFHTYLGQSSVAMEDNSELTDLLSQWHNTCIGLLFEIIHAANNSSWNCKLKIKSFNVPQVIYFT